MSNIQTEQNANEIVWEIPCSENRLKTFNKSKLLLFIFLTLFSISVILYGIFIVEYIWCYTGSIFLLASSLLVFILKLKPKKYHLNDFGVRVIGQNKEKEYKWSIFRSYGLNNPYGDYSEAGGSEFLLIPILFMPLEFLLYNFGAERDDKFFYLDIGFFRLTSYVKIQVDASNVERVEKFLESRLPKK